MNPIRIICKNTKCIPSKIELENELKNGTHVVIQIEANKRILGFTVNHKKVIRKLQEYFPEFSVFFSGAANGFECFTIHPVIKKEIISKHKKRIIDAVDQYISDCLKLEHERENNTISNDWIIDEHGMHCYYKNAVTGQVVEAPIMQTSNIDNLDPYFFSLYVKSTPELSDIAELIEDNYHDARKIIDEIHKKNKA